MIWIPTGRPDELWPIGRSRRRAAGQCRGHYPRQELHIGAISIRSVDSPRQEISLVVMLEGNGKAGRHQENDGTEIYYKDWGKGQPIVFSHGWPLSPDDWDTQMLFFLNHGYRVIAHDRRGHGRSSQTGDGHDMDHYADDLAALTAHLDLKNAIHVGHSTGGR